MSVADVAAVEQALMAVLAGDAALAALLPGGVWRDVGPTNMTRFVVVQFETHEDVERFGSGAQYEMFRYNVTARIMEKTGANADAAAARIHALLHDQVLAPITGYTHMMTLRVERVSHPEIDDFDNEIRWWMAGGAYEIFVSPT
jgi:Protein of unknown function (DUF3168)